MSNINTVAEMVADAGGLDLQEKNLGPVEIAGWPGLPVTLFSYSKTDQDGQKKNGLAAMLNPSSQQTARWIVTATVKALGDFDESFAKKLVNETVNASGFQFLVRGVHLEAMNGAAKHKAYPFFNGVTVKLSGIAGGYPTRPLSEDELRYTISAPIDDVTTVGTYARIQSTTAQHYHANGGTADTTGKNWLEVVRLAYIKAWGSDEYELMNARAKALNVPH
jgi:hypothetical protein